MGFYGIVKPILKPPGYKTQYICLIDVLGYKHLPRLLTTISNSNRKLGSYSWFALTSQRKS